MTDKKTRSTLWLAITFVIYLMVLAGTLAATVALGVAGAPADWLVVTIVLLGATVATGIAFVFIMAWRVSKRGAQNITDHPVTHSPTRDYPASPKQTYPIMNSSEDY